MTINIFGVTQQMVDDRAWISVYEKGGDHSRWGNWVLVEHGDTTANLVAPRIPGEFEIRLYPHYTTYNAENLAATVAFTVDGEANDPDRELCKECGENPIFCPFCEWCADCDWEAWRTFHCRECGWGRDCIEYTDGEWCENCQNCEEHCECIPAVNDARAFNGNDYTRLVSFAEQGRNRQILGWDLRRPAEWEGVEWCDSADNRRVIEIDFTAMDLTGRLNLTNMTQLEALFIRGNQFSGLDVTGCVSLEELHANWNQLVEISTFDGLVNLRWVDLRYNNLDLEDEALMAMIEQYTIIVESNRRGQLYFKPQHDGKLTETMIEEIADNGDLVKIMLDCGRIVTIDPDSITDTIRTLNLNVEIEVTDPRNKGEGMPDNSILIRPAEHGDFGLEISYDISAEELEEAGLNPNRLRLFHVDNDGEVVEEGRVTRNADGSVTISITRASKWVLSETAPEHHRTGCGDCGDCEDCNPECEHRFPNRLVCGVSECRDCEEV
jgi:hypothetical protein